MKIYISEVSEMMELWSKSNTLNPYKIARRSNKKALWECLLGHEWEAVIGKIFEGQRCPYCAGKKILTGFNDLETLCPEILYLWDYEKNTIKPSETSPGSHKKVWWKCELNHSWLKDIQVLTNKEVIQRCPYCSNHRILKGFNDLATTHPKFLKLWDFTKNKEIVSPTQVTFASGKKVWWRCGLSHSWEAQIAKIVTLNRACPYCSVPPRLILSGFNDLTTKFPKVLKYWDYEKNTINPSQIAPHSEKYAWWKCTLNHTWKQQITKVSTGTRCPYCAGKKVWSGFNDLLTHCPNIIKIWRNKTSPSIYHKGSNKTVSVVCPINNKVFKTAVYRITASYPFCSCFECINCVSSFERNVNQFINDSLSIETTTNDRSIISPKELDIVIEEKKIAIECNGTYWHSDEIIQKARGVSSKDFHQMKKDLAKAAGYDLFFVWEDDWKNHPDQVKAELSDIVNNSSNAIELLNRLD